MQTTAIGTVAKSLPQNVVILLTLLIPKRYIPYTDLRKNYGKTFEVREKCEPGASGRRKRGGGEGKAVGTRTGEAHGGPCVCQDCSSGTMRGGSGLMAWAGNWFENGRTQAGAFFFSGRRGGRPSPLGGGFFSA